MNPHTPRHLAFAVPLTQHADMTCEAWPTTLPRPRTSFVGRGREIAEARRLLHSTRLLTLTGAGGIGKTRLGHELAGMLAGDLGEAVVFVDLAPLADATQVPGAVAVALGLREEEGQPPMAALADALGAGPALLVLDNCDHLIEGCAEIADGLLRACPELRIMATSRQPLRIDGETTIRVPSLSLVPDLAGRLGPAHEEDEADGTVPSRAPVGEPWAPIAPSEAARLFVERARATLPAFTLTERNVAVVEQICRRLDGIPLAIELAAARIALLSPEQIADRLVDRFALLSNGNRTALPRYRTLRALVDWSHDLLDEQERILLRRLAVFVGGWTLEAAESVCAVDGLESDEILDCLAGLVSKSLVLIGAWSGEVRYWFLETLRAYATEKLREAGEESILHQRHCDWFLDLVEQAEAEMDGPMQSAWLRRLDDEYDNLRAALAWSALQLSAENARDDGGLRLAEALHRFWHTRGLVREGRRWLTELLARSEARSLPASAVRVRGRALRAAGLLAVNSGDHDAGLRLLAEAHAIARAQGDLPGLAAGAYGLGYLARVRGDYAMARAHLEDALRLFRELHDVQGVAETLVSVGVVAYFQGDLAAARPFYAEGLASYRALDNRQGMAKSLNNLGEVALEQGDLAAARRLEEECLMLASEIGDRPRVAFALAALGGVAAMEGESARALRLGAAATAIRESIGEPFSAAWQDRFDLWLAPARRVLGEKAAATVWAAGQALPLEQAIDDALRPIVSDGPVAMVCEGPRVGGQLAPLTRREREVAALVARGMTNRQIAAELVIAEDTAANHVRHIRARLGLRSRVQVAVWATERGLPGDFPA